MQNANVVTTGAQTDLKFDPAVVHVADVSKGKAYQGALLVMGIVPVAPPSPPPPETPPPAPTPPPKAETIAQANASGTLENVASAFVPGSGSVPPGEAAFITVKLRAIADGRSPLTLTNMEMLNDQGEEVGVGANNGEVVVLTGAPFPSSAAGAVKQPTVLPSSGDASPSHSPIAPAFLLAGLLAACAGSIVLLRSVRTEIK